MGRVCTGGPELADSPTIADGMSGFRDGDAHSNHAVGSGDKRILGWGQSSKCPGEKPKLMFSPYVRSGGGKWQTEKGESIRGKGIACREVKSRQIGRR
jgi:hypothetical protein